MLKMILNPATIYRKIARTFVNFTKTLERQEILLKIVEKSERVCYDVGPFGRSCLASYFAARPGHWFTVALKEVIAGKIYLSTNICFGGSYGRNKIQGEYQ